MSEERFNISRFVCAICERDARDYHDRVHARDRQLHPVCKGCESGMGAYNGYSIRASVPEIKHGAFLDRRIVRQIGALAEAIEITALRQNWERTVHGKA